MFLRRIFKRPAPRATLSPDLPEHDLIRIRADFEACLEGKGGALAVARRIAALTELFGNLSETGRARFAETICAIDTAAPPIADRYGRIEETEYIGGPAGKLAIVDAFVPPRRRLLILFEASEGGTGMLTALRDIVTEEVAQEISDVLAGRG